MSHYFLFSNNRVITPIGLEELKRKVRSGEVTEQHMISIDGGDWIAAREIQGLFPGAAVKTKSSLTGSESLRPPPPPSLADWFYSKNGQTVGPMLEDAIRGLAKSGVITAGDFVWTSRQPGAAAPAAHTPILADIFQGPPPKAPPTNPQHFSDDAQAPYNDDVASKSTTSNKTREKEQDGHRHHQNDNIPISNCGINTLSRSIFIGGGHCTRLKIKIFDITY